MVSLSIILAVCMPVIYSETKTADQIQVELQLKV